MNIQKLRRLTILFGGIVLLSGLGGGVAYRASAFAAPQSVMVADATSDACTGIGLAGGDCGDTGGVQDKASSAAKTLVNIISILVGVVAVVMVMIAGFRFVTSNGEPQKVAGAKSTLLYALIGLALVAASQAIVWFVLGNLNV